MWGGGSADWQGSLWSRGPSGQSISNWAVVGDVADSADRNFQPWSTGSGNQITVHVTNLSFSATVYLRLAGSCTTAPLQFPYPPPAGSSYPPGAFQSYWDGVFSAGSPGPTQYAGLIQRAFCWSAAFPGCSTGAPQGTGRFALHNGTNTISLRFRNPGMTRPPAIRLAGAAGCTARRLRLSVQGHSGNLRLKLRCRELKRGAAARVRITKPVRRNFRLRHGSGSIRVQLAKPPGTVKPDASLAYGRANRSCRSVGSRLRLKSRTFDLRVDARCGRAAGNAVAHLYIGGLLR